MNTMEVNSTLLNECQNLQNSNIPSTKLKECQLCHQLLPEDKLYKRKDRNGEPNWKVSYCKECEINKSNKYKKENKEIFRESINKSRNKHYHNNKDKLRIVQKRYYYNKLPLEKKEKYKLKLQEKYPEWVEQICNK